MKPVFSTDVLIYLMVRIGQVQTTINITYSQSIYCIRARDISILMSNSDYKQHKHGGCIIGRAVEGDVTA